MSLKRFLAGVVLFLTLTTAALSMFQPRVVVGADDPQPTPTPTSQPDNNPDGKGGGGTVGG